MRLLGVLMGEAVLLLAALGSLAVPVPPGVGAAQPQGGDGAQSLRWVDRHGRPLAEEVGALDTRRVPVPLAQVSPHLVSAVLHAEDRRFYRHGGIDVLATARALWDNLRAGRVVSGGSTITQQLARLLHTDAALLAGRDVPPRSLPQKIKEAHLALRLEQQLSKDQILEAFLNRAPFGHTTQGVEAAAQRYFEISSRALSLAQAALLAGLPQGPTALDPHRHFGAAQARQHYILALMRQRGAITEGSYRRALAEDVRAGKFAIRRASIHAIGAARAELPEPPHGEVRLTVDGRWQQEIADIVAEEIAHVYQRGGRSGAVVVIHNATGEVRAMVGAAFADNPVWGAYNAALAERQPGSALKPFIYAQALEKGHTAATLASDIERPFPDTWGIYKPENYDHLYHGPARYRPALAQSLNVAAVDVLWRAGLSDVHQLLRQLGLRTLSRRPELYGLGLALGSGPVRLVDLTNAYATLARGGVHRPWRVVATGGHVAGTHTVPGVAPTPPSAGERVISPQVSYIIADILADDQARARQFGLRSVLNTPYWSAVKTGTSKGFRDNWTVGFTAEYSVGVWVGDPTGAPMREVSGVEGTGRIWRRVMNLVTEYRSPRPPEPPGLTRVKVCHHSGALMGPHCEGGQEELFIRGTEPTEACTWHQEVALDAQQRRIPPGCAAPVHSRRVTVLYPSPYQAWAAEQGAWVPPLAPGCEAPKATAVRLLSPAPRERVRLDPEVPRPQQALPLLAEVEGGEGTVTFLVNGEPIATTTGPHQAYWPVEPGLHQISARLGSAGPSTGVHWVQVD